MKKAFYGFLLIPLLLTQAHALTCAEVTLQTAILRTEFSTLNNSLLTAVAKLEARRDIRVEDVDIDIATQTAKLAEIGAKYDVRITKTEAMIDKAQAYLATTEGKVAIYQDKLNVCLAIPGKDCTSKQASLDKAIVRVDKANQRIAKQQAALAAINADKAAAGAEVQAAIDSLNAKKQGYIDSYNAKIDQTRIEYNALITTKETEVNLANKTMQSLCGNAGAGQP